MNFNLVKVVVNIIATHEWIGVKPCFIQLLFNKQVTAKAFEKHRQPRNYGAAMLSIPFLA